MLHSIAKEMRQHKNNNFKELSLLMRTESKSKIQEKKSY